MEKNLENLIAQATGNVGSQRRLAELLEIDPASLIQMKQGKRHANWRIRGKLRAILGEEPASAFMAAMAEDLEQSQNEDEKKAADGFKSILAAFADTQEKSPTALNDGALSWRKRRDSNPR